MSNHTCNNLVVSCIDFRIHELVHTWLHRKFPHEMYDYVAFAGGIKNLLSAEKQVEISKRLHHITNVILIQHADCGAYAEEGTKEQQIHDLQKAKQAFIKLFPTLTIHIYYLHVSGVFEEIH